MSGTRITGSGAAGSSNTRIRSGESTVTGQGNAGASEATVNTPVGLSATSLCSAFIAHGISRKDAEHIDAEVWRLATSRVPVRTALDAIRGLTMIACLRAMGGDL